MAADEITKGHNLITQYGSISPFATYLRIYWRRHSIILTRSTTHIQSLVSFKRNTNVTNYQCKLYYSLIQNNILPVFRPCFQYLQKNKHNRNHRNCCKDIFLAYSHVYYWWKWCEWKIREVIKQDLFENLRNHLSKDLLILKLGLTINCQYTLPDLSDHNSIKIYQISPVFNSSDNWYCSL